MEVISKFYKELNTKKKSNAIKKQAEDLKWDVSKDMWEDA